VSYLSILQQMANQPSRLEAALSSIGSSAERYSQGLEQDRLRQQQEQERQRQMAMQQAQFIQQRAPGLMASKQYDALAGLQDPYRKAVKTAYGVDLPAPAVGAPVYGPTTQPSARMAGMPPSISPDLAGPPMARGGVPEIEYTSPPPSRQEIRRDFSGPQSIQAMRNLFAPEPPKLQSVGGVLYNQETGEFVVPPTALTAEQKLGVEGDKMQNRLLLESARQQGRVDIENIRAENREKNIRVASALRAARPGAGVKLIDVMLDDGTVVRAPDQPGVVRRNPKEPQLVQIEAGGQVVWGRKIEGEPVYQRPVDPFVQELRANRAFESWLMRNNRPLYEKLRNTFGSVSPQDAQAIQAASAQFNASMSKQVAPAAGAVPPPPAPPQSTPRPMATPRVLPLSVPQSGRPPGPQPVPARPRAQTPARKPEPGILPQDKTGVNIDEIRNVLRSKGEQ
jgi:hypothetical protein